jgi:general stress protein 26
MAAEDTHREHLYELLEDFAVAMIVTHGIDGSMIARPMAIARIERDGAMFFTTPVESTKADEVLADPNVTVVVQSKTQFASVRGVAHLSLDRKLIHALWQEAWRAWYPAGKDDPDIAILIVVPHHAEYWDNAGAQGLRYAFEAARAYLAGRTPDDHEEHAEVDLTVRSHS